MRGLLGVLRSGCYPGDDCTQMPQQSYAGLWLVLYLAFAIPAAALAVRAVRKAWLNEHRLVTWRELMTSTVRIHIGVPTVVIAGPYIDLSSQADIPVVLTGLVVTLGGLYLTATGVIAKGVVLGLSEHDGRARS